MHTNTSMPAEASPQQLCNATTYMPDYYFFLNTPPDPL